MHGCTRSLGGKETPGPLVVARIPSEIVPVCVVKSVSGASVLKRARSVHVMACMGKMASVGEMACVSACGELKRGWFQMEDGCGEPFAPCRVDFVTAPSSRDVVYEACSADSKRPSQVWLHTEKPARECPAYRKRPSRGWLNW